MKRIKTPFVFFAILMITQPLFSCKADKAISTESGSETVGIGMKIDFDSFKSRDELQASLNELFPKGTDLDKFLEISKKSGAKCSQKTTIEEFASNTDKDLVVSTLETDYVCQYIRDDRAADYGVNLNEGNKIDTIQAQIRFKGL